MKVKFDKGMVVFSEASIEEVFEELTKNRDFDPVVVPKALTKEGNDFMLDLIEYEEQKQKAISNHPSKGTANGPNIKGPIKANDEKESNMKTEKNNTTNNGNGQDVTKMVEGRKKKGQALINLVEKDGNIYKVMSARGKEIYTVSKPNNKVICSCDDFSKNDIDCKHIWAVRLWWDREKERANGNGKSQEVSKGMEIANPVTGEVFDSENLNEVVRGWKEVKGLIINLYTFKDQVEDVIVSKVDKPEHSKTAHLETEEGRLKIEFKENVVWEQELLSQAVSLLGEKALGLFKIEYKPDMVRLKKFQDTTSTSEKVEKAKNLIAMAKLVKPTKPYISLESRWQAKEGDGDNSLDDLPISFPSLDRKDVNPVVEIKETLPVKANDLPAKKEETLPVKSNGIDPKFVVQIQGKDFIKYEGLLELGHRIGIKRLRTKVVHMDSNGVICEATLELEDGRIFTDIGDACEANCNEKVVKHWIRIASTRAKARVLRDATNIGMVAVEELDWQCNDRARVEESSSPSLSQDGKETAYKDLKVRVALIREGNGTSETPITNSTHAYELIKDEMESSDRERFVSILLDTKNQVVGIEEVSIGSLSTSIVHPREVFKSAILANASSILVAHNHPSGVTDPSREDMDITRRLKEVGELMGIKLLDHIIIGNGDYLSMSDKGMI